MGQCCVKPSDEPDDLVPSDEPDDRVPIYLDCRSPFLVCWKRRDISNDDIRKLMTNRYLVPRHRRDACMKVSRYSAGILVRFENEPVIYAYNWFMTRNPSHPLPARVPASFPVTDFEDGLFENDWIRRPGGVMV